jgi:hypothetical protein
MAQRSRTSRLILLLSQLLHYGLVWQKLKVTGDIVLLYNGYNGYSEYISGYMNGYFMIQGIYKV